MPWMPKKNDPKQRALARTMLIFGGIFDMALAGFFLAFGHSVLEIEHRFAWMIAAVLAAGGVIILFIATLGFGRQGQRRDLDEGENDEPIVRR